MDQNGAVDKAQVEELVRKAEAGEGLHGDIATAWMSDRKGEAFPGAPTKLLAFLLAMISFRWFTGHRKRSQRSGRSMAKVAWAVIRSAGDAADVRFVEVKSTTAGFGPVMWGRM